MPPLLIAVGAAAAYGAADFLGGLASRRAPPSSVIVSSQALALVLGLCAAPLLAGEPALGDLLWGAGAGLAYAIGLTLLYRGLASGEMSIVAPITGICSLALPVLFGLAAGERLGAGALGGILLAGVAIDLVSREPASGARQRGRTERQRLRAVVFIAIGGGAAFGVFLTAIARSGPQAGLWPIVVARALTLLCHLLLAAGRRRDLRLERSTLRIALAGGALDVLANILYLLSTRGAPLSLAATVTSLYPAATVLLASLVLGERIHLRRGIGLMCAALAVILISATH
ncbi:MAG TPA: EamA family transporter [Polyangiaceae bacterium]|jgi:uncharacterized membrane protein|nr:EamA family transporter [Polyangiaceae bacterium]